MTVLSELIASRRSIKSFTDQPVAPELVEELLESAIWGPNHRMTEPWRFVIVTGAARDRVAELRRTMDYERSRAENEDARRAAAEETYRKIKNVPLILVVAIRQDPNPEIREEDYAAAAALVENFMLLAWERGLGTAWKTFKDDPRLRDLLGLAADEKVVTFMHVGYPAGVPKPVRRTSARERVTRLA